jgi:glycosyltransferase involved in cell wall biosynthesis
MKVCLVSREYPQETGWGGIGTYTYQLAHALTEYGHKVHIIAQSLDTDKEYNDGDVFVHRISHRTLFYKKWRLKEFALRLEYSMRVSNKILELKNKYGIDIVEGPNLSAETFIYSLKKRTPLVTRLHTNFSEVVDFVGWQRSLDLTFSCYLEEAVINNSDLVTCSTKEHARFISNGNGRKLLEKIAIVPLGIELPILNESPALTRKQNILFVGRLEKRKGIQVLIKAIPLVLERLPDTTFTIIGRDTFVTPDFIGFSGDNRYSFKNKLLGELPEKYRRSVNFLDYVNSDDLKKYYGSCNLFVGPSLYESFGLIYLEAMSFGKPVIGCGVGGVPEVVDDGYTGILVPPEDYEALAGAIVGLLSDNRKLSEMGINARALVENKFSREIMAKRTLDLYESVIKN